MPYDRPTVAELMEQQTVDLSSMLKVPKSQVAWSNAGVLAKVQAGGLHGLHGHLSYIIDQSFEDTAEAEFLKRRADVRGIPAKAETKASGNRVIAGTDGAAVVANTLLQRVDGVQFTVTTGATIVAGAASIAVEAVEAGVTGNTAEDEPLTFVTPVPGINSTSAAGVLAGGVDAETDESLRARTLEVIREPPHGGADRDYVKWVKETPSVNIHRIWVERKWMGAGTVGVFFTVDGGVVPDAATVQLVQDYVADADDGQAPITADVYVIAPTAVAVPITISGLSPDTPTVRTAAEAELSDLFARSANVENGSGSGLLPVSHIREAVSIASGEYDHVITAPAADVTFNPGELPVLGAVTWT
ncbi:baseplate J/gp47 family protein [Amphritea sp. HPY]|uniref:baseplate J/gp47 family protein n=1 Tax=Amphritea sp. HPY TaxID=3421652 RepID=UPI003D7DA0CC